MKIIIYKILENLSKTAGVWIFDLMVWIVTAGHFLFSPGRVHTSISFYRNIFPRRSWFYYLSCSWRQFHNFSKIFKNRILLNNKEEISYSSEGMEYLDELKEKGRGGIIVMSHVGNWEIAARLLSDRGFNILLYMGVKNKEQLEKMQKHNLAESGVKIIAVEENEESPHNIIDGLNFIKSGGIVSLTGDRIWGDNKRTIPVTFFGHRVSLPEAPHIFSLLTGAPLYIFFSMQKGKNSYHMRISRPHYISRVSREKRHEELQRSAQYYATILEETVREYPHQWYHFEEFLNPGNRVEEKR